jgi:uncharacterized iron-regulated membrane protein
VTQAARSAAGSAPISFVELRMDAGSPVGQVAAGGKLLKLDAASGAVLVGPDKAGPARLPPAGNRPSLRNTMKNIHRMTAYGDAATVLFFVLGLILLTTVATGLWFYLKLMTARAKLDRGGLFWFGGGAWRTAHRSLAVAASFCLLWVAVTGVLCSIGSLGVSYYRTITHGKRPGLTVDMSSPLSDAELAPMLATTLASQRAAHPDQPIKVVRLRYFAGMPQGVVVYGGPQDTRQAAFDTRTGGVAPLTAANYPFTGQTFGWQGDQILKGLHRGDFIGLPGRWVSLATGLSLLFLSVSGAVMYLDLWNRRRRSGRPALFWR